MRAMEVEELKENKMEQEQEEEQRPKEEQHQ
jgi:hypothetical protein